MEFDGLTLTGNNLLANKKFYYRFTSNVEYQIGIARRSNSGDDYSVTVNGLLIAPVYHISSSITYRFDNGYLVLG